MRYYIFYIKYDMIHDIYSCQTIATQPANSTVSRRTSTKLSSKSQGKLTRPIECRRAGTFKGPFCSTVYRHRLLTTEGLKHPAGGRFKAPLADRWQA